MNVVINLRKINGDLVNRQMISFDEKVVCNYSPPNNFEGSVEVEAFSIKNLRIPYAAVMAVYESTKSVSMVHSYARAYSQHEMEDKRTICNGEESCWTLRDSIDTTSFAVFHNGPIKQKSQIARLSIRNSSGEELAIKVKFDEMKPFETKIIEPKNYFENIIEWLNGFPGNARMSFKLNGGFTRMLCGVKKVDNSELQVTHTNFDYSTHDTDKITQGNLLAYMRTPNLNGSFKQEIVVYPDSDKGEYTSIVKNEKKQFSTGDIHRLIFNSNEGQLIEFTRKDKILPTRIVTALRLNSKKSIIPAECSMGIEHHKRPKKNFHWMIVSQKFNSQICWVDFQEIYGGCPDDAEFVFKLYNSNNNDEVVRKLKRHELPSANLIKLNKIFEDESLGDEFLHLTIWCSYGGLMLFSTMEKYDSITIEHSF